jgi:hypothetical protein
MIQRGVMPNDARLGQLRANCKGALTGQLPRGVVAAPSDTINRHIATNGGCAFFGTSLAREFNRADHFPFGKSHIDWTADDYQRLRDWSVRGMDPWTSAPGRREYYLGDFN